MNRVMYPMSLIEKVCLLASVEGSQGEDYSVNIYLSPQGIESASCTCPYNWDGWCKHIIVTLYYYQCHTG